MNATFTKISDAQPVGTYAATAVDAAKRDAAFRIVSLNDGKFDLAANAGAPALSGRGIKARASGIYQVTRSALERVQASHSVVADF